MSNNRLFLTSVLLLLIVWICWPTSAANVDVTRARLFCSYGRVFIQFEEKYNTWGTMWLDNKGRPVPCDDDGPIEEQATANTI